MVADAADLYSLTVEQLADPGVGFAQVSAEKLVRAIDASRHRPHTGSSPRSASSTSARRREQILATRFGTLDGHGGVGRGARRDLGIGPKIAESIATWFSLEAEPGVHREAAPGGRRLRCRPGRRARGPPPVLAGRAVVVSGTLVGYTADEATAAITARGGTSPQRERQDVRPRRRRQPRGEQGHQGQQSGVPILDEAAFERLPRDRRALITGLASARVAQQRE